MTDGTGTDGTNDRKRGTGRVQFLLIATVFFGPLLFATWLYYGGEALQPKTRSNHGALLEPIVNLRDRLPESAFHAENDGHWLLLYANEGACGEPCAKALYTIRQSRLMLGQEMQRVTRIFLHGETPPDTLLIASEHEGLVTLEDAALSGILAAKRPAGLEPGGYYLIDPLSNLVMYFRPDINPSDMVDDIKHLLRLSQIG